MGMFGEATGSILRLPKFLGVMPARAGTTRISTGQLDTLLNQVENVTRKARDLVAGRSQTDLTTSLESASWSVAQCLDHLAQTTNAFLPAISVCHRSCSASYHQPRVEDRHSGAIVHPEFGASIPAAVQSACAVWFRVSTTSIPPGMRLKSRRPNWRRPYSPPLALPLIR